VPSGGRRRATFAAVGTGNTAIFGFHVKRGTDVVDLTGCSVVDLRILSRLPALRTLLGRLLGVHQRAEVTVTLMDGDLDVVLEWPGTLGLAAREALAAFAAAADVARVSWRPSAKAPAETVVQLRPVGVVFAGVRVALPAGRIPAGDP
jgi:23S rRNA (uracil1939-C5)-methyltransferase